MLCEINGIKITEADIKDSLRSVPSKVGDMDGIHMIMGVIETEDRKTRLVTLSNSSVYIFKQGECKFYNQLDKSRIFMKDSHRYGDDNDNDFFWFMYNPSREDLKFFDEENEAKDFARKSGR